MDELQIATTEAVELHRLFHSDVYSTFDGSHDPRLAGKTGEDTIRRGKMAALPVKLASDRATATKREFEAVLKEVEMEVMTQLAKILSKQDRDGNPIVAALKEVAVAEEGASGEVCGVCTEEMSGGEELRALGCQHMFHRLCIEQWVVVKTNCPLCRYPMLALHI